MTKFICFICSDKLKVVLSGIFVCKDRSAALSWAQAKIDGADNKHRLIVAGHEGSTKLLLSNVGRGHYRPSDQIIENLRRDAVVLINFFQRDVIRTICKFGGQRFTLRCTYLNKDSYERGVTFPFSRTANTRVFPVCPILNNGLRGVALEFKGAIMK